MQKDADMTWEGTFPYDTLAAAGITPQSSMGEILKAMSHFSRSSTSSDEVRAAWKELRKVDSRLFYDFFLYRTESPSGKAQSGK